MLKFVNEELLKNTNILPEKFWSGFDKYIEELTLKNEKDTLDTTYLINNNMTSDE